MGIDTIHDEIFSLKTPSYAGLTRVSINLRKNLSKWMDCRVKPGNDGPGNLAPFCP
jgi:hypothetical protein